MCKIEISLPYKCTGDEHTSYSTSTVSGSFIGARFILSASHVFNAFTKHCPKVDRAKSSMQKGLPKLNPDDYEEITVEVKPEHVYVNHEKMDILP